MRRRPSRALAWLVSALALAWAAQPGGAEGSSAELSLKLADVELSGDPGWRAINQFTVNWDLTPSDGGGPYVPTAVEYRLEGPDGSTAGPIAQLPLNQRSVTVSVPPGPDGDPPSPGLYRLALWLRSGSLEGPVESVTLPLDNGRPTDVRPLAPGGWIRAGASVELGIEHPGAPRPLSGIRGYAVELDHGSGSEPCAAHPTCQDAEVNLPGGEDDDSIVIGPLAEQTNVARVVAVSGSGMRSAVAGAATLHVDGTPPAIAIAGAPNGWSDRPVKLTAAASDDLSGMGAAGSFTAIAVDGGPPSSSPGARASAVVHGDGSHEVTAFARDAVGNLGAADPASSRATVWIDETAPRIAFAAHQDPIEPERIVARVEDSLSGPSRRAGSIAIRPAGSHLPFQPLRTDTAGAWLVAHWDSDSFPRGSYEFRAIGFDRAGNRGETDRRANGTPMVLPNPVKTPAALALGFGGRRFVAHRCRRRKTGLRCHRRVIVSFARRPATTSVGYGRGVPVGGRLTAANGEPLRGLPVELTETFEAGAEPRRRTTTAVTGADGVFLAHLRPGPSRRIRVGFAGTRTLAFAGGRELRLAVRTGLRLRASSATAVVGGAPVVFSGRLGRRGANVPRGGLPVALEFRVAGLPWTEFRTVQTDARGRFRYPYSFSDDDSRGIRFQFRAHLASQPGWPYDAAYSRPVAVTGR